MRKSKGILRTELYYVDHLDTCNEQDLKAIDDFYIADEHGQGLDIYLKHQACEDEDEGSMRTYLVWTIDGDECVGYFSLKAGLVSLNETVIYDEETGEKHREFDTFPGIELANFAVNSAFVDAHPNLKGIGQVLFSRFITVIADEVCRLVGVKMIYIFALPYEKLIKRYQTYGFNLLPAEMEEDLHKRLKPRYDESCFFMYLTL